MVVDDAMRATCEHSSIIFPVCIGSYGQRKRYKHWISKLNSIKFVKLMTIFAAVFLKLSLKYIYWKHRKNVMHIFKRKCILPSSFAEFFAIIQIIFNVLKWRYKRTHTKLRWMKTQNEMDKIKTHKKPHIDSVKCKRKKHFSKTDLLAFNFALNLQLNIAHAFNSRTHTPEMNTMREQFEMRYGKLISRSQRLVVENVKVSSVHCMFVHILFNELAMMVSETITLPWWMDICLYASVFHSISMDFTCTHTQNYPFGLYSFCLHMNDIIHTKTFKEDLKRKLLEFLYPKMDVMKFWLTFSTQMS